MTFERLTEKQIEFVRTIIETEKEIKDKVFFCYPSMDKKLFSVKINSVDDKKINISFIKPVNDRIANKLEEKGILISEKIDHNSKFLSLNEKFKPIFKRKYS